MKNIDSFMRFVKAHEKIVAAMSDRISYEFIIVEIDGKRVLASPTSLIEDWEELFKSVKFHRDKGHSVVVLKGRWEMGK